MKKDTHPKYNGQITATCECGAKFVVGSTKDEISTEICSNCHPFYTGKSKLVDTAGRVEKFRAAQEKAKKEKKKNEEEVDKAEEAPEVETKETDKDEKPAEIIKMPKEEEVDEAEETPEGEAPAETEEEAPTEEEEKAA